MIIKGGNTITGVYRGSVSIKSIYKGSNLVFSSAPPAPIAPIVGMQLWLKSDTGITYLSGNPGYVEYWTDQSSHGWVTFANYGYPHQVAGGLNGYPKVNFTNAGIYTPYFGDDLSNYTMFLVGTAGLGRGADGSGGWSIVLAYSSLSYVLVNAGGVGYSVSPAGYIIPAVYTGKIVRNGAFSTTASFYNNDTMTSSTVANDRLRSSGVPFTLGYGISITPTFFNGDIYEVLVYESALSDEDRLHNLSYLRAKYAI